MRSVIRRVREHFRGDTTSQAESLAIVALCLATCVAAHLGSWLGAESLFIPLFVTGIGMVTTRSWREGTRGISTLTPEAPASGSRRPSHSRSKRVSPSVATRRQAGKEVAELHDAEALKASLESLVSKELCSPMAAIVSAARIITEHHSVRPDVIDRFGPAIASEGERIMKLLKDCLELSAMHRRTDWANCKVDATSIVNEVLSSLQASAASQSVQLIDAVEERLPVLNVDRRRIAQVLTTLVQSAMRSTPSGGSVTVRASLVDGALVFGVDDTGAGTRACELAGVFDRNGLELRIAREIVRHYDGDFWAASEAGQGSTFGFTLPVQNAH